MSIPALDRAALRFSTVHRDPISGGGGSVSYDVDLLMTIAASPETVWRFLSEPSLFAAWIGSSAGMPPASGTSVDPRVGGEIVVEYPGGAKARGRFTVVEPAVRVAFTWGYDANTHGLAPGSTEVSVDLAESPEGTIVRLRHRGLPSADVRNAHAGGWTHYLTMLSAQAAARHHAGTIENVLNAYFDAWSEGDDSKRMKLLQAACTEDVRILTAFANLQGCEALSGHIASGMKHMPGMTLKRAGGCSMTHGWCRQAWGVHTPNGVAVMKGVNVCRLALDGRIEELVSFSD